MEREDDIRFIRMANRLAIQSGQQGFDAFSALLVFDGKIVATSADQCIFYSDPTAHAELTVISEYCRKMKKISLSGYTMYCNVEPCIMCSGAIHWSRISRLVYGVGQEALQKKSKGRPKPGCREIINCGHTKIEIVGPLIEDEGRAVLDQFPFLSKVARHQQFHST